MDKPVITRFAPSPTGFLHVGGARTALFNWLYAKHMHGKMFLRIEDTDRGRLTKEAVAGIVNDLQWLGIDWDGEVICQFERAARHREVASQLIKKGKAYYCYYSMDDLVRMREKSRMEGKSINYYNNKWRDFHQSSGDRRIEPAIRIKVPSDGKTLVRDKVQGDVYFCNRDLDDFIILRSDGTPTYMLAVVVDDHDMGISHVIRGNDHLTNAARQTILYEAMEWEVPVMAHIPLIHGIDGSKLSKRYGAISIDDIRRMGFLPIAVRNYLVRLGWSHGNNEIMSTKNIIRWFDIIDINKGAARFDIKKLEAVNSYYLRTASNEEILEHIIALIPNILGTASLFAQSFEKQRQKLYRAIPGLKERSKTLCELLDGAAFIFAKRPLQIEAKALAILASDEGRTILKEIFQFLKDSKDWTSSSLEKIVRSYAERTELKLGKVAQLLRASLTGRTISLSVFEILEILDRDEALARIEDQII